MANSALGQTGFGADAIATSNVQNSAITAAKIADDTITEAKMAAGATLQLGTKQASTSGTYVDFTGIPAGTKEIVVMLNGVSTNGTSNVIVQLGDSGGIETSGYLGCADSQASAGGASTNFTTGFGLERTADAAVSRNFTLQLFLQDAATFTWMASGIGSYGAGATAVFNITAGVKALSAELDRVRITTVNGTDTFDAGSVNIAYK